MNIKIEKRTVRLLLVLIIVTGTVSYKNKYYNPKISLINTLKATADSLELSIAEMQINAPDVSSKKAEISEIQKKINDTKKEFTSLGVQIPRISELDRFLFYLTQIEFSKGISFESIKPFLDEPKTQSLSRASREDQTKNSLAPEMIAGYRVVKYEIKISGDFANITHYLNYLNNLSKFASISEVIITQNAEKKLNTLYAAIIYSIMISGEPPSKDGKPFKVEFAGAVKDIKSPFQYFKPEEKETVTEPETKPALLPVFHLSGIISIGSEFRAIIDDAMYKTGDLINGTALVRMINKDKVILDTNGTSQELFLEAQGGENDKISKK